MKRIAVLAAVLLLAAACIRAAAVAAWGDSDPERAAALWPSHPRPQTNLAMAAIGAAAARGSAPPAWVFHRMQGVLARDPLAVEPFTVLGTDALAMGQAARAERLLSEAAERDPRALAPRVLLADIYLRASQIDRGLLSLQAMMQQLNPAKTPIVAALAAYARQPGAATRLKPMLARDPLIRTQLLTLLSADPAAADIVLALHQPGQPPNPQDLAWQDRLISGLLEQREFARAHEAWRRLASLPEGPSGLFNPDFANRPEPPPFNWRYAATNAGLAEPIAGGGLRLVHFGRDDAAYASQVMLLAPGRYQLGWRAEGQAEPLAVTVTCLGAVREIARVPLASGKLIMLVEPGCPAQRIDFRGLASELPSTTEARVSGLRLAKVAS